jgi:hypothetical protein
METEPPDPMLEGLPPIVEEARALHVKMSALVGGLRETLDQYGPNIHACAAVPCELCEAVEAARAIVRDFDRALSDLGARLGEDAICLAWHGVTR